jgi:hypothetical protein
LTGVSFFPLTFSSFFTVLGIRASSPNGSDTSLFSSASAPEHVSSLLLYSSVVAALSISDAASSMSSSLVATGRSAMASFTCPAVFENYTKVHKIQHISDMLQYLK